MIIDTKPEVVISPAARAEVTAMNPALSELRDILALLRADQWNAAHDRVQRYEGLHAAWLHGLLHLQEGDLEDAENWYERAGRRFRQRGTLAQELMLFEAALDEQSGT